MSDSAILAEVGDRVRQLRLRRNMTQQYLAEQTTLSLNVIKGVEKGKTKLASLIAVLRVLNALEQLESFIPEPEISPLQAVKTKGKQRKRARPKPSEEDVW